MAAPLPPGGSQAGYESIGGFGGNEPPPPPEQIEIPKPEDPLNPGRGIPLRDDGVDLDELSGSTISSTDAKKNKRSNKEKKDDAKEKKKEEKTGSKKSQKKNPKPGRSKTTKPKPPKPAKVGPCYRLGIYLGPIFIALGLVGLGFVALYYTVL